MSFGNNLALTKRALAVGTVAVLVFGGLLLAWQLNAASNCTGPTFDAGTGTLSLVCTESTDIHELSCADATNPDTLSLTVNGSTETVTCPPDVPPNNPPTMSISGPTSGDWGTNYSFTFMGTDLDAGDTLTYEVDWDSDGIANVVPASGVTSGTSANAAWSWSATGAQTFQARVIDKGGPSPWVNHTITIGNPPPAQATLTVSVEGGPFSDGPVTVNPGDRIDLRYEGQYATSCDGSGTNFSTGGGTSGSDQVSPTAAGIPTSFSLSCSGPGGTGSSDNLVVTTRQLPNLTTSQNASPQFGTFDPVAGTYSQVTVYFRTQNNGGSDTTNQADYRFELDLNNDGSYETNVNRNDGIGTIAVGGGENDNETVTGPIPFGTHGVRITADSSGNPGKVSETNESDNVYTGTITTTPPDPGLDLTANPLQVQNGQGTTISWTIGNPYDMNCSVFGPGISPTYTFNPLTSASGNLTTSAINAKSEYTLRCVAAGTTFTDTVTVETQGVIEEI